MDLNFGFGSADPTFSGMFDAAQNFGSGNNFDTSRTADTQTSNAIQSAQPITQDNGGSWSGFWQNTIGSIVGYAAAKDAAQTRVNTGQVAAQTAAVQQRTNGTGMLMVAVIGFVGYLLITRGK